MSTDSLYEVSHLETRIESASLPIFLRTIRLSDAPSHSRLLSLPENGADPAARPIDPATSERIITKQLESLEKPTTYTSEGKVVSGPGRVNMVVCLKTGGGPEDDVVIGLGGFGAIKDWERNGQAIRAGDVGVMLDPKYRGKGYAVEAMKLATDWAFTPATKGGPQLDLVTITTLDDNKAIIKLVEEKLGLKDKGILRLAEFDETKQEKYYELTAELWHKVNKK
jgi:RimJ/RimL family protein N-acetyltransferase